jgi:glycosyltransferase involved in cell wall biosynthesis
MKSDRPRICVLVSSEMTIRAFMRGHLATLQLDYDVVASANCTPEVIASSLPVGCGFSSNGVEREISLRDDLRELRRLRKWFSAEAFDAVHTITPKAGLLGMLAARLARVPVRMHTFTGQVWATEAGLKRRILRLMDKVLARCCTHPLADSHSQLQFLVDEGVLRAGRGMVPGDGSIAGVDIERFHADPQTRTRMRSELGITHDTVVFVFVGRLNRDKGVSDLVPAFVAAAVRSPGIQLLLVGPDEGDYGKQLMAAAGPHSGDVHLVGSVTNPESYLAAADVFCLPSYREGFGVSVIEAAACGLPAIVSEIYGLTDAVVNETTGVLHQPGDVAGITECLVRLANSAELRRSLGDSARQRVVQSFSAQRVTDALVDVYRSALAASK